MGGWFSLTAAVSDAVVSVWSTLRPLLGVPPELPDGVAQDAQPVCPARRRARIKVGWYCRAYRPAAQLPRDVREHIAAFCLFQGTAAGAVECRSVLSAAPIPPKPGSPARHGRSARLDSTGCVCLATGTAGGLVTVWGLGLRQEAARQIRSAAGGVLCMCYTGGFLWAGLTDGTLMLLDPWRDLTTMRMVIAHRSAVAALAPQGCGGGNVVSYPHTHYKAARDSEERVCVWSPEGLLLHSLPCEHVWVDRRLVLLTPAVTADAVDDGGEAFDRGRHVLWDESGDVLWAAADFDGHTLAPAGAVPSECQALVSNTVFCGTAVATIGDEPVTVEADGVAALQPGDTIVAAAAAPLAGLVFRAEAETQAVTVCSAAGDALTPSWKLSRPQSTGARIVSVAAACGGLCVVYEDGVRLYH